MYIQGSEVKVGDKLEFDSLRGGIVKLKVIMILDKTLIAKVTSKTSPGYVEGSTVQFHEGSPWLTWRD